MEPLKIEKMESKAGGWVHGDDCECIVCRIRMRNRAEI